VRAPARNLTLLVLFCGVIAPQLEIRPFTSRQRAQIEEQRVRDISAAFARLEKALRNTARPTWGPSRPDRLAYLQAKFDRRVSDPASRMLRPSWRRCDAANEGCRKCVKRNVGTSAVGGMIVGVYFIPMTRECVRLASANNRVVDARQIGSVRRFIPSSQEWALRQTWRSPQRKHDRPT
jgi:hypothetical protein